MYVHKTDLSWKLSTQYQTDEKETTKPAVQVVWSGHVTHCNAFLRPTDELQGFNTLPTDRRRIKVLKGFDATKTLVTRKYRFSNFYLFVCLTWPDLWGVPFKT